MLADVFGNSRQLKVLDYLIDNQELDYSKSDIAEGVGISRTTVNRLLTELHETGIIVESRRVGNARMYKLDMKSPLVRELLEFDRRLSRLLESEIPA